MPKKRKLPSSEEDLEIRGIHIGSQFNKESDRGIVLLSATLLEENLELMLRKHFAGKATTVINPLFEGFGPLATFSGKIKIAYAFGLLTDDEFHDLEIIREIQNHFAHRYEEADFDQEWVAQKVGQLRHPAAATDTLRDICFRIAVRLEYDEDRQTEVFETPMARVDFIVATMRLSQETLERTGIINVA
jgi:DNA-binding MltR family transcriptional regulator